MTPIRLLIVDDHALFRRGLVALLQNEPQLQVSGQAANGEQALRLVQEGQVDVVLMDKQGAANREIALALSISESTVKTHVAHILEKLKVLLTRF